MLKIKEVILHYIYQKKENKGVIMDIQTFEASIEMLEDYEDAVDFEVLKTEGTTDYGMLKQQVEAGCMRLRSRIILDNSGVPIVDYGYIGGMYIGKQRNPVTISQRAFVYEEEYRNGN